MPSEIIRKIKGQVRFKLKIKLSDENDGYLRLVHASKYDAELLAKWRTDHYDNFFTRIKPSEKDMLDWLKNYESDYTDLMFMIEYPPGVPIGQMALSKIDLNKSSAEFGRIIRSGKRAPHNIMQLASKTIIEWAFSSLRLQRIYLEVFADNQKALDLYSELGFRISEVQYYHKTITSRGIERYAKIERKESLENKDQGRLVLKMIFE